MKMPFRDDLSALEARRETLERDLSEIRKQKRELAGLDQREKELEHALQETNTVLTGMGGACGERKKSLLDNVRIAAPCPASWDDMVGNGRVRFCLQCEKNVYNLSAMPREEAEELLRSRGDVCVRLYRRADDTIITSDCPVGVKIRRAKQRRSALLGIGGAVFVSSVAASLVAQITCTRALGGMKPLANIPIGDQGAPVVHMGAVPARHMVPPSPIDRAPAEDPVNVDARDAHPGAASPSHVDTDKSSTRPHAIKGQRDETDGKGQVTPEEILFGP